VIRLACALGLIAIVMAVILVLRTDGASAIGFSFIGAPALGLALTIYGVSRWRAGVFRSNAPRTPEAGPESR
jgi:hypothetical protein